MNMYLLLRTGVSKDVMVEVSFSVENPTPRMIDQLQKSLALSREALVDDEPAAEPVDKGRS